MELDWKSCSTQLNDFYIIYIYFFSCLLPLHDLSAVLACEQRGEARLLSFTATWFRQCFAWAELRVLCDGVCLAIDAEEASTLPPHFVAAVSLPLRFHLPFTVPASRLHQLLKFLSSRMLHLAQTM